MTMSIHKIFPDTTATATNMTSLTQKKLIKLNPKKVYFKDVVANQAYEVNVIITNTSKKMIRLKIGQPTKKEFRCDYDIRGPLAAGLSMKIAVTFETESESEKSIQDTIPIWAEGEEEMHEIQLIAKLPCADVIFPPFINFQFIRIGQSVEKTVLIHNDGKMEANVQFNFEGQDLKISEKSVKLSPKMSSTEAVREKLKQEGKLLSDEANVKFTLTGAEPPDFVRKQVDVIVDGEKIGSIDVSATVVKQTLSVVFEEGGGQQSEINFRHMYYGETKSCDAFLVNNGPENAMFSVKFIHSNSDTLKMAGANSWEEDNFKTPKEYGEELCKRVMTCEPQEGKIPPYSQMPIKFICRIRKEDKKPGMARKESDAFNDDENQQNKHSVEYSYVAQITSAELKQEVSVTMKARVSFPSLKLEKELVDFGECRQNERKEYSLKLENSNRDLPLTVNFSKIAQFFAEKTSITLGPNSSEIVKIFFAPKNFGKFYSTIDASLLYGLYKNPIKVIGVCKQLGKKLQNTRGPDALPQDFQIEAKSTLGESEARKQNESTLAFMKETSTLKFGNIPIENAETMKEFMATKTNKKVYNQFIKEERLKREKRSREIHKAKITSKPIPTTLMEYCNDIDLNINEGRASSPQLEPPHERTELWVIKQIGNYEPTEKEEKDYNTELQSLKCSNNLKSEPTLDVEIKDCKRDLDGSQFQKIIVAPSKLEFGEMFSKSKEKKTFYVSNYLKYHIHIRLDIADNDPELGETKPKTLVIPPGQTGGFNFIFFGAKIDEIKKVIKYYINDKAMFKLLITAKVVPVELLITPTTNLDFNFANDKLENTMTETIVLTNNGNCRTNFSFTVPEKQNFKVSPEKDFLDPKTSKDVVVTYKPSPGSVTEKEKIILDVGDGPKVEILCQGRCKESKCVPVEKSNSINFGDVQVGIEVTKTFLIKNMKQDIAVFFINNTCRENLTITPEKDRIKGNDIYSIKVTFKSDKLPMQFDKILDVNVRGGETLHIPIKANAIIPSIKIKEESFDFGKVVLHTVKQKPMTIINESTIPVELRIDFTDYPEFSLSLPPEEKNSILRNYRDEVEDANNIDEVNEDSVISAGNEEESNAADEAEDKLRYEFTVAVNQSLALFLEFTPVKADQKVFDLPIKLKGLQQEYDTLRKPISGEGLRTRIEIDPKRIDFDKKIVNIGSKAYPTVLDVTIKNPEKDPIKWRLDEKVLAFDNDGVFQCLPSSGKLEGNMSTTIRVLFNPITTKEYKKLVPLFLDDNTEPYMQLEILGIGVTPKLYFDRREVILPEVPLNIVSTAEFTILNEGYENLTLQSRFGLNVPNVKLDLRYPDGSGTIGVTSKDKDKLRVEVRFSHNEPFSFTTTLEFFDDQNLSFSIPVCGVTDNSIMTILPYMVRYSKDYRIKTENNTIRLTDSDNSDDEDANNKEDNKKAVPNSVLSNAYRTTHSNKSSMLSTKPYIALGYPQLPPAFCDAECDFILRWLNSFILKDRIEKFPDDIINSGGHQIYEIIQYFTGKQLNFKPKAQPQKGGEQSAEDKEKDEGEAAILSKIAEYEEMLKYLMQQKARVNNVRPEFLLSAQDYMKLIKKSLQASSKTKRLERAYETRFQKLSMECWIALMYQIYKVFYINRVSANSLKTFYDNQPPEFHISLENLGTSNIYSSAEMLLLKWIEHHAKKFDSRYSMPVYDFDKSLNNSVTLGNVVQSHYGTLKSLQNIKVAAKSEDEYTLNAKKLLMDAFTEIGITSCLQPKDVVGSNNMPPSRKLVMLCAQLFQTLPHYLPKTCIEFPCILGETCKKVIELTNPSANPICYWANLQGSSDFKIESAEIRLEAKSTESYPVTLTSRISKPVEGKLIFTNKKEGNILAAPLVFELRSNVLSRVTEKTWEVKSRLYESTDIALAVTNKYSTDALFKIMILYDQKTEPAKKQAAAKKKEKREATSSLEIPVPDPFFCTYETLRLKKSQTSQVTISYLPFKMERHHCYVIFQDEKVGEIQHEINGTPEPPKCETITQKANAETVMNYDISIQKNSSLEQARTLLVERAKGERRNAMKEILNKIQSATPDPQQFNITMLETSQYFKFPNNVLIYGKLGSTYQMSKKESSKDEKEKVNNNKILYQFNTKLAGKYRVKIALMNGSKTDIRLYEIEVNVNPQAIKAQLIFEVPARKSVTQDIPFINETDKDWSIEANIKYKEKDPNANFKFNQLQMIPHKSTSMYKLTFSPGWLGTTTARLIITNQTTKQIYKYKLTGTGSEPLAEANIKEHCRAKEAKVIDLEVKGSVDRLLTYKVETDLGIVSGNDTIKVNPNVIEKYKLTILPLLGGTYYGSITFTDQDGKYLWYTIEITSESPAPEKVLDLKTIVRKAISVEISLKNPIKEAITFDVIIKGEGLIGDSTFQLKALETAVFELVYSPIIPGQSMGKIGFLNEKTGEFWYDLNLIAEESPIQNLDPLECELGKMISTTIVLENPIAEESLILYSNSNKTNFDILPDKILLPAYSSIPVTIRYTPSSLDNMESASIVFKSEKLGKWEFYVEGKGLVPTEMDLIKISASVGSSTSSAVQFKNPFKDAIIVDAALTTEDPKVFSTLGKKNRFSVPALGMVQIPFSFSPYSMIEATALITISINKSLQWKYPIKGIAESVSHVTNYHFKCKARSKDTQLIKVQLNGLINLASDDEFSYELKPINQEFSSAIEKTVLISILQTKLTNPTDPIELEVKFEPFKPFKCNCELFIYKSSGGRWKYNTLFEALEPEIDDTISITSPLGKTSSVSFRLTNHIKKSAEFKAFFTHNSSPEFAVVPATGNLEPYGSEGTTFIVSFSSTEYGKVKIGRLIIQTDDMQWSYEVRGTHPQYQIPRPEIGKVDTHLDKSVESIIKQNESKSQKNFLRHNIGLPTAGSKRTPKKPSRGLGSKGRLDFNVMTKL